MATFISEQYKNGQSQSPTGMSNASIRCYFKFPTAVTLALGDIIKLCKIPSGHALVSVSIDTDALGTACVGKAGILNAGETAVTSATHTSSALSAQAVLHANTVDGVRAGPSDSVRTVGIEITTAASAALSANAVIGATVVIRPRQPVE